jgi:hypothetical protein
LIVRVVGDQPAEDLFGTNAEESTRLGRRITAVGLETVNGRL